MPEREASPGHWFLSPLLLQVVPGMGLVGVPFAFSAVWPCHQLFCFLSPLAGGLSGPPGSFSFFLHPLSPVLPRHGPNSLWHLHQ